ncbi:MAG: sodium-dependent transporter [Porticoccaceae bacterium]|nr:sodium-dependent transporter [Porticoccaceae bacterium]|tara:strand:- start:4627 stop:5979 length:1353 start_codon:yes stop_codon:yes gene_type:complete
MKRGQFSSRLAFILAASGSAVGLGNIWGFPSKAAENGGGAFLLMYLFLAFLLAYPALMAELTLGRHGRSNMVSTLDSITSGLVQKRLGQLTGIMGVITATMILCFYSIIAGWMMAHTLASIMQTLKMYKIAEWLVTFSLWRNICFSTAFISLTLLVISAGVEKGIEIWSKRLMPCMLLLLLGLIVYVLLQPGAEEGLKIFLVPDFTQLADPQLILSALGQAFFSLSLGVGTMLIYGSYIRSDENLPVAGALVTVSDTGVAVLAGMLIIPALFAAQQLGVDIYTETGRLISGPDLIFHALPALFEGMGEAEALVAIAFFTLMSIAALTSSISMFEVPVSWAIETQKMSRLKASIAVGVFTILISGIISYKFTSIFEIVVVATTEWAQPILSLMLCLFCGWLMHRNHLLDELKQGVPDLESGLFWRIWPTYVKIFCPLLIVIILVQSFLPFS